MFLTTLGFIMWHNRPTSKPTKGITTGGGSLTAPNIANLTVYADSNYVVVAVEFSSSRRRLLSNQSVVAVSELRRELAINVIPGELIHSFSCFCLCRQECQQCFVVNDLIIFIHVFIFFHCCRMYPYQHVVATHLFVQGRYIVLHISLALPRHPQTNCLHRPTLPATET